MIIFMGEHLNYEWTGEIPTPLGWIDHEFFTKWLLKLFVKNIPQTRPVLLLLDGHSSHYTPEAVKIAAKNEIALFICHPILFTWPNHLMLVFWTTVKTLI